MAANLLNKLCQKAKVVNKINIHFFSVHLAAARKLMWSPLANSHILWREVLWSYACMYILTSYGDTFMLCVACVIHKAMHICVGICRYLWMGSAQPTRCLSIPFQTDGCIVYNVCMKKKTVCHTHSFWRF